MRKLLIIALIISAIVLFSGCEKPKDYKAELNNDANLGSAALLQDSSNENKKSLGYTVNNPIVFKGYDVAEDKTIDYSVSSTENTDVMSIFNAYIEKYVDPVMKRKSSFQVSAIEFKDAAIKIIFKESIYQLNLGVGGEAAIIQNLVDAYIKNIPEVNQVFITVEGKDYESGHLSFKANEPVAIRNNKK